jgi:hypothetical protein
VKYVLLIYEDDAARVEKMDEWMTHCAAYVEAMKKAGIHVTGDRLAVHDQGRHVELREVLGEGA